MFKGKPVMYQNNEAGSRNQDGSWEKIWFPDGAPPYYKDTEMEDEAYDESTKAVYMYLRETGSFQGGIMPFLPPKREWCLWDF
jgi:nucleoporin NUP42